MFYGVYRPPVTMDFGYLHIYSDDIGITRIDFIDRKNSDEQRNDLIEQCCQELNEYFTHKRQHFTVPLHLTGTDFQLKVWQALQTISYGQTASYKELAEKIGSANHSRAVGLANSKNPVLIIVPCHRVIGSNKTLTGYAGGLHRKKALLTLENGTFIE